MTTLDVVIDAALVDLTLPHHCNGCTNRWNGYNTCHWSACHTTFSSIDSFDRHRRTGQCLVPAVVGLARLGRAYECWGRRDDRHHPFSLAVSASDGSEAPGQYDCRDTSGEAQISESYDTGGAA